MATTLKTHLTPPNTSLPEPISIDIVIQEVLALHEQAGGATFSLYFGNQLKQRLYSVSAFPDRSRIVTGRRISSELLAAFINANQALLSDPRCCIGTWFNVETGRTYLDILVTVTSKRLALSLARRYNQEGVYDLFRERYTETGGTGEMIEDLPPLAERLPTLRWGRKSE